MNTVSWDYFDKFKTVNKKYLPSMGEGETMATQIVTAVNKLIYKWYNNGDVFDNTHYMIGWCNDLSSYANWLHEYVPNSRMILNRIFDCHNDDEYEMLLMDLADLTLDMEWLDKHMSNLTKVDSIYDYPGPFKFEELDDEEDLY